MDQVKPKGHDGCTVGSFVHSSVLSKVSESCNPLIDSCTAARGVISDQTKCLDEVTKELNWYKRRYLFLCVALLVQSVYVIIGVIAGLIATNPGLLGAMHSTLLGSSLGIIGGTITGTWSRRRNERAARLAGRNDVGVVQEV